MCAVVVKSSKDRNLWQKYYVAALVVFVAGIAIRGFGECVYDDSVWNRMKLQKQKEVLSSAESFEGNSACLCKMVTRVLSSRETEKIVSQNILSVIERYIEQNGKDVDVFMCLYQHKIIRNDHDLWEDLLTLWENENGPIYRYISELVTSGQLQRADSLYTVLDTYGKVDSYDQMKWASLKGILGQYQKAAEIYCRVSASESRLFHIALSQIVNLLKEIDNDTIHLTLQAFRSCYLRNPNADTVLLRNWLADTYGRFEMYDEEVQVLVSMDMASSPAVRKLIEISRERFAQKLYRQAIYPASLAYRMANNENVQTLLATILYQSYLACEENDSALTWLSKIEMQNEQTRIDAIVLYQNTGHFHKAASLIDTLHQTIKRDTLLFRQLLLTNKPVEAESLLTKERSYWSEFTRDIALWKMRIALFQNDITVFAACVDSFPFYAAWPYADEILSYKYWLQASSRNPEVLTLWANIEYDIFRHKIGKAAKRIVQSTLPAQKKQQLAVYLVEKLLDEGMVKQARNVLENGATDHPVPAYLFYYGEVLLRFGVVEKAKESLQQLLLMYPDDVYANKARILLREGIRPDS